MKAARIDKMQCEGRLNEFNAAQPNSCAEPSLLKERCINSRLISSKRISDKNVIRAEKFNECYPYNEKFPMVNSILTEKQNQVECISKGRKKNRANILSKFSGINARKEFKRIECSCVRKCGQLVSKDKQKAIFETFWNLKTYHSQCAFLCSTVQLCHVARRTAGQSRRKTYSRRYFLGVEKVCKNFYMNTLQISTYTITSCLERMEAGIIIEDPEDPSLCLSLSIKEQLFKAMEISKEHEQILNKNKEKSEKKVKFESVLHKLKENTKLNLSNNLKDESQTVPRHKQIEHANDLIITARKENSLQPIETSKEIVSLDPVNSNMMPINLSTQPCFHNSATQHPQTILYNSPLNLPTQNFVSHSQFIPPQLNHQNYSYISNLQYHPPVTYNVSIPNNYQHLQDQNLLHPSAAESHLPMHTFQTQNNPFDFCHSHPSQSAQHNNFTTHLNTDHFEYYEPQQMETKINSQQGCSETLNWIIGLALKSKPDQIEHTENRDKDGVSSPSLQSHGDPSQMKNRNHHQNEELLIQRDSNFYLPKHNVPLNMGEQSNRFPIPYSDNTKNNSSNSTESFDSSSSNGHETCHLKLNQSEENISIDVVTSEKAPVSSILEASMKNEETLHIKIGATKMKRIELALKREFKKVECTCPKRCSKLFTEKEQNAIFQSYWKLNDWNAQTAFICETVELVSVKRRTAGDSRRRKYSRKHYFGDLQVCKTTYLGVLQINHCRIDYCLGKKLTDGNPAPDGRGRHSPPNKTSQQQIEIANLFVEKYIERFHLYQNCHPLKHKPTTMTKIYREYCDNESSSIVNLLSLAMFKKTFKIYMDRKNVPDIFLKAKAI